ncbi:hypothetical protein SAMD00019534_000630 [Acytostelium subglobosum LB1]|uniref:hypothetical protein n=1 Tax=Acytostelium subglobosum LB1 TaxID=1410327 RepID=UPI000645171A|nr:hypothetical protein SAMD00019534_000630 [Acytostelium subglobosum LB1]GAM16888.1 hypothetical protein SAMD00019534_000630 [Acytostelium subglobosum LB1]|eukprot:XP_012758950.1 hypothetical protein SAMD00019534_000630 [Acytostelium subglobosum LB1]
MFLIQSFVTVTPESAALISDALQSNTSLTELNLSGHNLGVDGCKALSNAIKSHGGLTRVSLGHETLGSDHDQLELLMDGMLQCKSLLHIDLAKRSFNALSMKIVEKYVVEHVNITMITSLDLSQNALDNESLSSLARVLNHTKVNNLNLSLNSFDHNGLESFVDIILQQSSTKLNLINLTGNQLGNGGGQQVARLMQANRLHEVEINECHIGDEGANALGQALVQWQGLHLAASENAGFSNGLALGIREALKSSSQVQPGQLSHLALRGCNIGDEGVMAIAEAIQGGRLPKLTVLDIAVNSLTLQALQAIGTVLMADNPSTIISLDISCNDLGLPGVELIGQWLQSNKLQSLETLSLNKINIGINGQLALCKSLTKFPASLKIIESMGNSGNVEESDDDFLDALDDLYEETIIDFKWK